MHYQPERGLTVCALGETRVNKDKHLGLRSGRVAVGDKADLRRVQGCLERLVAQRYRERGVTAQIVVGRQIIGLNGNSG